MFTPLECVENAALVINDGVIVSAGRRDAIEVPAGANIVDFGDAILAPGLIDIHVHGGAGRDLMEGSDDALGAVERLMAKHGVTSYCPTTVTAPMEQTLSSLEKLAGAVKWAKTNAQADRAQPLGIHLEGPFLSHARRGVHPSKDLQAPSARVFAPILEAAAGEIAMMTIAPELSGAMEIISDAASRGIRVSLGHTNADAAQGQAGIKAGARHATHTFNAMRRIEHRNTGVVGVVLTDDSLTADIIVDGVHVEPAMVEIFVRAKGLERAVLITDATSATGMPDGVYHLGSFEVEVKDGRCQAFGKLAGSVLTMDRAVRNVMSFARLSFQDSLRLATLNPACVLGIEDRKGMLKPGADADVTVFTPSGEVLQTIVRGMV
jgi:N-acetylglucosamine-6-phosphate deacetylase